MTKICHILNDKKDGDTDRLSAYLEVASFVNTVSVNSYIYDDFHRMLNDRYELNDNGLKLLNEDETLFEKHYPLWDRYFENIMINHIYYMNIPYVDKRIKKEDCIKGICLLYALLRIICSISTIDEYSSEKLSCVIADIFHLVEHSSFYYNANVLIHSPESLLEL